MFGITLNCFHQIGNQVITPPQLDVHLSPGIVAAVPQDNQAVVKANANQNQQAYNYQQNNYRAHLESPFKKSFNILKRLCLKDIRHENKNQGFYVLPNIKLCY
jgi:hypothetical protein